MKWEKYKGRDILPMWVADMDFLCPTEITEALVERARHGTFGYTVPYAGVEDAVIEYMARDHGLKVEREWIVCAISSLPTPLSPVMSTVQSLLATFSTNLTTSVIFLLAPMIRLY